MVEQHPVQQIDTNQSSGGGP